MTAIEKDGLTGKICNELERLGYRVRAQRLVWFTDQPIHPKSVRWPVAPPLELYEPYVTSLGEKTALKFLETLRGRD